MKKKLKAEQREWTVNKKSIVPTREAQGRCVNCNKILSKFNLTQYCFNHQYLITKREDEIAFSRTSIIAKYYRKRKNERNNKTRKTL